MSFRYLLGWAVVFFLSGCANSLRLTPQTLKLAPQPLETQKAAVSKEQAIVVSQQFNVVTLSPHSLEAVAGIPWRFYVDIKNGSLLDLPFEAHNISVTLNGNPVSLASTEAIKERILRARDEAILRTRQNQKRLIYGDFSEDADLDDISLDTKMGSSIFDLQELQRNTNRQIQSIEARTKVQLAKITAHSLENRTIPPKQNYDTFIEFLAPSTLNAGDIISVKIAIEPDVHEFRFEVAHT